MKTFLVFMYVPEPWTSPSIKALKYQQVLKPGPNPRALGRISKSVEQTFNCIDSHDSQEPNGQPLAGCIHVPIAGVQIKWHLKPMLLQNGCLATI